ncbi:MAG TPA: hypothetical protein VK823_13995 [Streptosporangiaceae bacterium]|jgi:hypothetical protein|nr:hypothetical protein [Streptosporangiaceae bacterium]
MLAMAPETGYGEAGSPVRAPELPGYPWSVRLAGPGSACPALEIYEGGDLIDIVSSTRIAVRHLRGARTAAGYAGPRVLAWGRMPATGTCPEVEFGARRRRGGVQAASVIAIVSWCWVALAEGSFATVTVRAPAAVLRQRVAGGRPWC